MHIDSVRKALRQPLPGAAAQRRMAPQRRGGGPAGGVYRDGAVLLLLYPRGGELFLALTRRCEHLASHAGQISFPGGVREPEDESFAAAALRETREELGIDTAGLELLGLLTPLEILVSGYRIHPWVAYAPTRPAFRPDPSEVAELLEVPLALLLDPLSVGSEQREIRGEMVQVRFFAVGRDKVWGATAMVLSEFLALLPEEGRGTD